MTRDEYEANMKALWPERYDYHAFLMRQWDAEHGVQVQPQPAAPADQPEA